MLSSLETPGSEDCLSLCPFSSMSVIQIYLLALSWTSTRSIWDSNLLHQTLVKSKVEALKLGPMHRPAPAGQAEV